ncbi:MAG TPA: type II CRISPR RNA-guided endonuclease Cas9, partial [Lachnospiraceae bacterium]|nr:type II CRISPR RNA-guided endonuclease Cas9 [Lachnospiraceae bacterium]
MIGRNWYLGLDMGTTTVGWACTYENYELLRLKGKDAWGIREFQEAETATARRTNRISRRRRQREIARIGILKDLFHDAIMKEDTLFYVRLDESKLLLEDKSPMLQYKDGIFHDKDYTDKEYFREYKTIFHLRKALIYDEVIDNGRYARLVYLALLNMFKHRGHFLNSEIVLEGAFKGISISFHDLMSEIEKLEIEGF